MSRNIKFSDGNVRPVGGSPHELMLRVNSMEVHGRAAEAHRRRASERCELATADRKAIVTLMRQRGLSQFWHDGHIYRLSCGAGADLTVERCPALAALSVVDSTAEEEARAGTMPDDDLVQHAQSFHVPLNGQAVS
jgi:hypothetical protein